MASGVKGIFIENSAISTLAADFCYRISSFVSAYRQLALSCRSNLLRIATSRLGMAAKMNTPLYPLFVIGSPRSGTSILVDALLSAGYWGFREGMLLQMIYHVDQMIDRQFSVFKGEQNLISAVDKDKLKADLFQVFKDTAEANNKLAPWFDKTGNPDMILAVPVIAKLWPNSAFVFAKRRGIENVLSRMKKFPRHNFEYHCTDWAKNMATWREVRTKIDPFRYIEIDQFDIIQQPEYIATRLREFLRLPPERQRIILTTFQMNRPQQTAEGTAARVYSLDAAVFSDDQRAIFLKNCKIEMDAYGYSIDQKYRSTDATKEDLMAAVG